MFAYPGDANQPPAVYPEVTVVVSVTSQGFSL